MFFNINNKYKTNTELFKLKIYRLARSIILLYSEKSTEKNLNQYLLKNYKISLKLACLKILQHSLITKNSDGNFIVVFNNPTWDQLAKLITYGTGHIQGSNILKDAFMASNKY